MDYKWQQDSDILTKCQEIREFASIHHMRLSMHPGQYTLLNSPRDEVLMRSIEDLEYHREMAVQLGVTDLITHVGGVYQDKQEAIRRWIKVYETLSSGVKKTPSPRKRRKKLLHSGSTGNIPEDRNTGSDGFHHHRILPSMDTKDALIKAAESWEGINSPKVHLSSGRTSEGDSRHHDLIKWHDYERVRQYFRGLSEQHQKIYLMLEAKKKEQAVLQLRKDCQKEILPCSSS